MRALLALPLALAALLPRAHGATACTDCSSQACILDGTATSVAGGATALTLSMCNFDASALSASDFSFGALYPPACDAENATFPVATALTAADGCTADACSVTVTLESGLDWALALHGASGVNAITAELVNGSGKSEVVTVGTFQDVAGAAMVSTTESVSVCATKIPISASRLSYVEKCNVAQLCQGAAADTSCTTALQQNLYVADVACQSETCTGNLTLTSSLPCDGSSGDATSLIVAVQVATSTISNYLSVGSMVATNFTISAAEGVDVGSSEIVLTTDTFCEASSVNLSLAYGSTSASGSSADTIEFSSLNTTSNGTIVVELSSPLKQNLEGEGLTFSLSQCGITASAFTATVGAGSSSSDEDDSASDSIDGSDNDINNSAETGSEGTAQESDSSTGLSGGLYVGIGIGVVAFLGFVGECYIHKRRQAKQPAATNPNPATATIGYANTM